MHAESLSMLLKLTFSIKHDRVECSSLYGNNKISEIVTNHKGRPGGSLTCISRLYQSDTCEVHVADARCYSMSHDLITPHEFSGLQEKS